MDLAHPWWQKVEQDKVESTTWDAFKVMLIVDFVPSDERSHALKGWFFLS